ncbi:hypothetical protein N431DRAFT_83190 [Stipitochalara longipes BDJ]|nr:hypothetical protein N431DRAFT_83190 [Stipitochalara longipes BDJ]
MLLAKKLRGLLQSAHQWLWLAISHLRSLAVATGRDTLNGEEPAHPKGELTNWRTVCLPDFRVVWWSPHSNPPASFTKRRRIPAASRSAIPEAKAWMNAVSRTNTPPHQNTTLHLKPQYCPSRTSSRSLSAYPTSTESNRRQGKDPLNESVH